MTSSRRRRSHMCPISEEKGESLRKVKFPLRFGCALGAGRLRTSCAQRALGVRAAHMRSSCAQALSERSASAQRAQNRSFCAQMRTFALSERSASAQRALSERSASAQAALGVRKLSARFALRAVPQPSDRRAICERKTCDFCAAAAPARASALRTTSGRRPRAPPSAGGVVAVQTH